LLLLLACSSSECLLFKVLLGLWERGELSEVLIDGVILIAFVRTALGILAEEEVRNSLLKVSQGIGRASLSL
jgi:hypothetical protein